MRILLFLSEVIIPLILFYIVGFGILMKCDVYEMCIRDRCRTGRFRIPGYSGKI